ncbi:MAG: DUF4389 domain-containing protein [Rhodospirillales bacterium]|nr:MAG: DUF4389 domain-containing protein [Rhodospirillales bacterium]
MYDDYDDGDWTSGFRSRRTWTRGFFMLLFLVILWLARLLLIVVAVFQFGAQLITRRPVGRLLPFGRSLAIYLQEIALFLTYNSEYKPFPFASWPDPGPAAAEYGEDGEEGEPYEAYEAYAPEDAPFEPEPEPEPEPRAKSKAKGKSAAKKKSSNAAEDENPGDDDADSEDADEDDDGSGGGRPPPRPDA